MNENGERKIPAALRAPGQKLPGGVRETMEVRFGQDFSGVRIHLGVEAEASAAAVEAKAYTIGQHIVFGTGHYATRTAGGQALLAHELAHVVQQSRGGIPPSQHESGVTETGAQNAANAISQGQGTVAVTGGSGIGLAREPTDWARRMSGEGMYRHVVKYPNMEAYNLSEATTEYVLNSDGTVTAIVLKPYPPATVVTQQPLPKPAPPKPKVKPPPPKQEPPVDVHVLRDVAEALAPRLIYPKPVRQFFGGLQFVGGGLEAGFGGVGGLATAETGVGLVAGAFLLGHGADVASSGWTTMWTGEESKTYTFMAGAGWGYAAGADPKLANALGQSTDLIANIGAAGLTLGMAAAPMRGLPAGGGFGGMPPRVNPFAGLTDAEIDLALENFGSRYYYRTPISVSEDPLRLSLDDLVPVSRWGRPGLRPGDWVMPGNPNLLNYSLSFKWDPNPFNLPAPFVAGEAYMIPADAVKWPRGFGLDGWFKGLFSQRRYIP